MSDEYTLQEQELLLGIARRTLEAITTGGSRPYPDLESLPPGLREERACFVSFHIDGELRGCTGTLAARRPLADEVSVTTVQTAFNDPRFSPVVPSEVAQIKIDISVLTPSYPLTYADPDELLRVLRPGIDGVTLSLGPYRSTFLPQVWEHVPDKIEFLAMLSRKMGLPADAWKHPKMKVELYQSFNMAEPEPHHKPSRV
jgi:AmmeMemoRadiSam system protein A